MRAFAGFARGPKAFFSLFRVLSLAGRHEADHGFVDKEGLLATGRRRCGDFGTSLCFVVAPQSGRRIEDRAAAQSHPATWKSGGREESPTYFYVQQGGKDTKSNAPRIIRNCTLN